MLIGYVSDERYLALPEVLLEFEGEGGLSLEARSRASGAVHADLDLSRRRLKECRQREGGRHVRHPSPPMS